MNISNQGEDLLMQREAKRNAVYLDSLGTPTVGVGHTGPEVILGDTWTDEQVMAAFRRDLQRFEDAINDAVIVPLEQHQFDALVSFAFNVGAGAASKSTLVEKINEGDLDGAIAQFDRWHIPPEITSRRNGEKAQFAGTAFEAHIA